MPSTTSAVTSRSFGTTKDGRPATLWTLRVNGLEVAVTDFGATIVAVRMPDRAGRIGDVVLGFDDVQGYQSAANQYFGCTTGRVCNRIANGRFELDGKTYHLACNNGEHHLHGGAVRSFDKVHWQGQVVRGATPAVRLTYHSPDGEEGYPGNVDVAVTIGLLPQQPPVLTISYEANVDRRTPLNLTNHAYWNLAGAGASTVLDHRLQVLADRYTPTDDGLIPTGVLADVAGTPLDFRQPVAFATNIESLNATAAKGFDHNLVLRAGRQQNVARLWHPTTQRSLVISTSEPGLQIYTGNYLNGQVGKGGERYAKNSGVCLETQHFPDSVNRANFPTTIVEPGTPYRSFTHYQLGVTLPVDADDL